MPKRSENQVGIHIRFKESTNQEAENALWAEIFDILGIFDQCPVTPEVSGDEHSKHKYIK